MTSKAPAKSTPKEAPQPADAAPDATFGALLRVPYAHYFTWLYEQLTQKGFPDIRDVHSAVFRNIDPQEGSRVTDMARAAGMTKQSMAYLVEDLQKLGYVASIPDKSDRRAKIVVLTAKGQAVLKAAADCSAEYEALVEARMGANEAADLRRLLEKLMTTIVAT